VRCCILTVVVDCVLLVLYPQLLAKFREFAPAVEARVVRDRATNISRGFAFIEFPSVQLSTHVLHQVRSLPSPLVVDKHPVRVAYARSEFRRCVALCPRGKRAVGTSHFGGAVPVFVRMPVSPEQRQSTPRWRGCEHDSVGTAHAGTAPACCRCTGRGCNCRHFSVRSVRGFVCGCGCGCEWLRAWGCGVERGVVSADLHRTCRS